MKRPLILAVVLCCVPVWASINASNYCSTPGVLDQSCILNALSQANGATVYVPAGSYTGTIAQVSQSSPSLVLDAGASLNFGLYFIGRGLGRSNTVASPGTYPVGSTTFAGDFSAFQPGSVVVIEQVTQTIQNQVGIEFATAQSASNSGLVLSAGTRFPYGSPNISLASSILRASGSTPANSPTIQGDFTSILHVGDIVRIENTTATDSPSTTPSYFEIAKVASINASGVTFESALHSSFGNPWIAKISTVSNVSITGSGYIKQLWSFYADSLSVSGVRTQSFLAHYIYNFKVSNLRSNAANQNPTAFDMAFASHGNISNIVAYGANSPYDSGSFDVLGLQDSTISNVSTYFGTATAQSNFSFMVDSEYTPYSIWNSNVTVSSVTAGLTNTGESVFLAGFRGSSVSDLTSQGAIRLLASTSFLGNNWFTPATLTVRSGSAYSLSNFTAGSTILGADAPVTQSRFNGFNITGQNALYNRGVWILPGCSGLAFSNGEFASAADHSFFLDVGVGSGIYLDQIKDAPFNGGFSVFNNSSSSVVLGANQFGGVVSGAYSQLGTAVTTVIGGQPLNPGQCSNGTAIVPGAVPGMPVRWSVADGSLPLAQVIVSAAVTQNNLIQVQECAWTPVTPPAKTFSVSIQ